MVICRNSFLKSKSIAPKWSHLWSSPSVASTLAVHLWRVLAATVAPGNTSTLQVEPSSCFNPLGQCQDTLGALAPCSGFLPSRPARRPSAVHGAQRLTRLNQVRQAPRGKCGENSPHIYKEHPEGKNGEKIFAVTELPEGQYMSRALRPESEDNMRIVDDAF